MVQATRYSGPEVYEMREQYFPLMRQTRSAATQARKLLAGKMPIELPAEVQIAGKDAWLGDLPHKKMGPQRVRQNLIAKQWELRRSVTSGGYSASSVSTRLEQPLIAIMRDKKAGFPWADVNDLLLIEGIAFSTVLTNFAGNDLVSELYGPDQQVSRRFSSDARGRLRGDDGYDESSFDLSKATAQAEAERQDIAARNLPFRQRAHSIRQCAPIWGSGLELQGLVIETDWTTRDIKKRGLYVTNDKEGQQAYPLGALQAGDQAGGGGGATKKVTELWYVDDDGKPYVSYCVEGKYTWRQNGQELEPHVIDLSKIGKGDKQSGLTRLPISWGWGLGWSAADLDERAMPFTAPFMQSWRNIDALITAIIVWCQWRAFPSLIEKVPLGEPEGLGMEDKQPKNKPAIRPMSITQVTGDVTEIATQGIAPGVFEIISLMQGENKQQGAGDSGGDASSGIQLSLSQAFEQDALTTVHESALDMVGQNASFILEGGKVLGEVVEPVRVYQIAEVLIEQKKPSSTNQMLTLEPDLIGSSFDVVALRKKTPGESPATRQQNAALVKEGFYSTRWFLEQDGYEAPEAMAMEVEWEQLLKSEPGQAATFRLLEQYVSDQFIQQIQAAMAKGQANPQTGLPVGAAQGLAGPPADMLMAGPQADGGMVGMGSSNPAAAQLAATAAAPLQQGALQSIQSAGGALPVSPMQMGAA